MVKIHPEMAGRNAVFFSSPPPTSLEPQGRMKKREEKKKKGVLILRPQTKGNFKDLLLLVPDLQRE